MKIEDLKVGDLIIQRLSFGEWRKAKVERTTKTQIIVKGVRYKRNSGYRIGGSEWGGGSIGVWTEDLQIEWELKLQMKKNRILLEKFADMVKPENLTPEQKLTLTNMMIAHGWNEQ